MLHMITTVVPIGRGTCLTKVARTHCFNLTDEWCSSGYTSSSSIVVLVVTVERLAERWFDEF